MSVEPHEIEPFGQGKDDRCAVACARYLLQFWQIPCPENTNWASQKPTEEYLCHLLAKYKTGSLPGFSYVAVAQMFLTDFDQKIQIRCGENVECQNNIIAPLIERGKPDKLQDWLLSTASDPDAQGYRPVMVGVEPEILDDAPRLDNRHSVVVLYVENREKVYYLEPDSSAQTNYPKYGVKADAPIEKFMEAWEEHSYLALTLN